MDLLRDVTAPHQKTDAHAAHAPHRSFRLWRTSRPRPSRLGVLRVCLFVLLAAAAAALGTAAYLTARCACLHSRVHTNFGCGVTRAY